MAALTGERGPLEAANQKEAHHEHHLHHVADGGPRYTRVDRRLSDGHRRAAARAWRADSACRAAEIKASENPVFIPYSTDTKGITLTWTQEIWQPLLHLTVTESGTPAPVIDKTVGLPPPNGEPLTATYGKTYTAQLKDVITNQPLGAPLTITTDRIDIKIDMGCVAQCITSVVPEPHGGWAQFTINTTETASMTLEASKTKPNANGTWSNPKDVTASTATILPTQNWKTPLADLDSNTTFYYVVRAHDANGNEQVKTGSFKTLTRRVDVTFAPSSR